MAVVAAKGVVGAVGVAVMVTVAEDCKVVTELLVIVVDVPKVPKLHTMLVFVVVGVGQIPLPELVLAVPALVEAEFRMPAVPKIEAVNIPPFTGSPVL